MLFSLPTSLVETKPRSQPPSLKLTSGFFWMINSLFETMCKFQNQPIQPIRKVVGLPGLTCFLTIKAKMTPTTF